MAGIIKKEILLESGTNELEIMEFIIGGHHFGINVAKVAEIMRSAPVTKMPNSNTFIEGVFKPRDRIMTVIDLPAYMGLVNHEHSERDIYIITNFNKNHSAFHVHSVEEIHRISWGKIEKPDSSIYGGRDGLATGIARIGDRLVTIVDFEKILADINPSTTIKISEVDNLGERQRNWKPLLIAEDSQLLSNLIVESLNKAGYLNITKCSHGKEAWETLCSYKENGKPLDSQVSCIISDIEMPQIDGHHLTKLVKTDDELKTIPLILFSSLISEEMKLKGKMLGADAQLTKPEIGRLIETIDNLVN